MQMFNIIFLDQIIFLFMKSMWKSMSNLFIFQKLLQVRVGTLYMTWTPGSGPAEGCFPGPPAHQWCGNVGGCPACPHAGNRILFTDSGSSFFSFTFNFLVCLLFNWDIVFVIHLLKKSYIGTDYWLFTHVLPPGSGHFSVQTILSPDISRLVKFARPVNSQLVDLQGQTFFSYLFCRRDPAKQASKKCPALLSNQLRIDRPCKFH